MCSSVKLLVAHTIPAEVDSAGRTAKAALHITSTGRPTVFSRTDMARTLSSDKLHKWVAIDNIVGDNIVNQQVVNSWLSSLTPGDVAVTHVVDELQFEAFQREQSGRCREWAVGDCPQNICVD